MRLGIIILFILLGQFAGFGQRIFRDGYVVKNNGDTLNGMVQFEANQKVRNICIFKRFDIANVVMYSPVMLKGFGYKDGNSYESIKLNNEVVFWECLLKGNISLYTDGKKLFLHSLPEGFVMLKNNEAYRLNGTRISLISEYVKRINHQVIAVEVPNEVKAIEIEVLPIIEQINKKISPNYIVYNRKYNEDIFLEATILTGSNISSYGVVSALNYTSSSLSSQADIFLKATDYQYSHNNWSFGLFYNRIISRMNTNLSFQSEIHFLKQSNYFFGVAKRTVPVQTYRIDLYTDINMFKIPFSIRYCYPIKKAEPFINLGLGLNYAIVNYSKANLESESATHEIYTYGSDDFGKKVNYSSFFGFVGIGLKYRVFGSKFIVVEGRYEIGKGNVYSMDFDYHYAPKAKLDQNKPKYQIVLGIGI